MGKAGRRRVRSYSQEFKLRAVQLSQQPGVLVRDVAESLCIHPFMLSRWRKQARDGEDWSDPKGPDIHDIAPRTMKNVGTPGLRISYQPL